LVGVGLIAMAGLSGGSSWTHLIPGFIVAGLGGGLVNPPLASTAIGVVPPHQADLASGVSSTFRQTGIAALGSIFTAAMQHNLAHAAAVAGSAPRIVALVRQGEVGQLLASTPPTARGPLTAAIRSAAAAGINDLLFVTGALALAGAMCALLLIRGKDFVRTGRTGPQTTPAPGGPAETDRGRPVRSAQK